MWVCSCEKLFHRLLTKNKHDPAKFNSVLARLFAAMSTGGAFGVNAIVYFNGGLFNSERAQCRIVP